MRIHVAEFDAFTSVAPILTLVLVVALFILFLLALAPLLKIADIQWTLLTALAIYAALSAVGIMWGYTLYARLEKSLRFIVDNLRLRESSVLLPRRMRAALGVLTIRVVPEHEGGRHVSRKLSTSITGDLSEVKPTDLVTESSVGVGIIVEERRAYEWVSLPVLEIRERGFRNRLGSVVLGFVPKTSYTVLVNKAVLRAARGGDWAEVELNPTRGVLRGRLKYMKHPFQSESRSARVELEVRFDPSQLDLALLSSSRRVLRKTLAELRESGAVDFEFRPPEAPEPVVIVGISSKLASDDVLGALGLEAPTVFGDGWRYAEARLRLVLDIPMGRDVVDEAEVKVEPVAELG